MTTTHTLRPGLLVSLSTSLRGNVSYQTTTLEAEHPTEGGEAQARWETERTIADPAEHAEAIQVRSKIRTVIQRQCSRSAFGLLCPEGNADGLAEAIAHARNLAEDFNARAALTRITVNVLSGRIAADDVEAVKAISNELRDLMEEMQTGLASLDVKSVRDAASKAKDVGAMLTPEARGRLDVAIQAARSSARKLAKAGETAAVEVDRAAIAQIDMARTSFLDLDMELAAPVPAPAMEGRDIDLEAQPRPSRITFSARGSELEV